MKTGKAMLTYADKECSKRNQADSRPGPQIKSFLQDNACGNDQQHRTDALERIKVAEIHFLHQTHPEEKPHSEKRDAGKDINDDRAVWNYFFIGKIHAVFKEYLPCYKGNLRQDDK
jgi:hypothetical protein